MNAPILNRFNGSLPSAICYSLFAICHSSPAATILWQAERFTGSSNNRPFTISMRSDPLQIGSNIVFGVPLTIQPTNSRATFSLLPGNYWIRIDQVPTQLLLPVPDSTNTYNAVDLVADGLKSLILKTNYVLVDTNALAQYLKTNGNGSALTGLVFPTAITNHDTRLIYLDNGLVVANGLGVIGNFSAQAIYGDSVLTPALSVTGPAGINNSLTVGTNISSQFGIFYGNGSGLSNLVATASSNATFASFVGDVSSNKFPYTAITNPPWVTTARQINTISPLAGGGALSGDLTLSVGTVAQSTHATNADFAKFVGDISSNQIPFTAITNAPWNTNGGNTFISTNLYTTNIYTSNLYATNIYSTTFNGHTVITTNIYSSNAFFTNVYISSTLALSNLAAGSVLTLNSLKQVTNSDLTGDVTTSGSLVTTLATVATPGTSTKLTYNSKGLVTSGATAILASADFANQGTATTVLHGNASGNPSFGAVALAADVSGTLSDGSLSANVPLLNANNAWSGSNFYSGALDFSTNLTAAANFSKAWSMTNVGAAFTQAAPIGVDTTLKTFQQTLHTITNTTGVAFLVTLPSGLKKASWWGTNVTGFYVTNATIQWWTCRPGETNVYIEGGY